MKLAATLALVIGMTITIDSASAQPSNREQQALNEVQYEMTTCAAFNMFARQCFINRGRINEDAKAIQLATTSMQRLLDDAQRIGRSIGMTEDAMASRLNIEAKAMMTLAKNDCVNFSSLLARYGRRCKQVMDDPDSILIEYLNRR
jgi:2-keto-4-pentenoate hydratase